MMKQGVRSQLKQKKGVRVLSSLSPMNCCYALPPLFNSLKAHSKSAHYLYKSSFKFFLNSTFKPNLSKITNRFVYLIRYKKANLPKIDS